MYLIVSLADIVTGLNAWFGVVHAVAVTFYNV